MSATDRVVVITGASGGIGSSLVPLSCQRRHRRGDRYVLERTEAWRAEYDADAKLATVAADISSEALTSAGARARKTWDAQRHATSAAD